MRHLLKGAASALIGALAAAAVAMPAAAQDKSVRIGWAAWSDAEAVTKIAAQILEEEMGYDVELVLSDIGLQYQGLADGDLDAMLMAWLPVTHASYMEKVGDQIVSAGVIYTNAKLGWVVPAYVPEDQVSSIEDLKKPEAREQLDGKIQGIDPGAGLMQASEKAIDEYGLDYELVSASGAAMTAALSRAIDRNEWIVVTGWSPHWKFSRWDLRYLDDPEGVLGGLERVHAMTRKGLYQDHPEVFAFLSRMHLPLEELQAVMLEATETSYEEAVAKYIEEHPARVSYWVTGEFDGDKS